MLKPVFCCAFAIALGSTEPATRKEYREPLSAEFTDARTAASPISLPENGSDYAAPSRLQIAQSVRQTLARHGLKVDRQQNSSESILFEFFNENRAGVEIYDTGEIVVVVSNDGVINAIELGIQDANRIVDLVKNGFRA